MFLNQLVNYNDGSHDLAALLVDVTAPPDDWDDAEAKFARLLDYCAAVKRGSHPQAGRSQFFLSTSGITLRQTSGRSLGRLQNLRRSNLAGESHHLALSSRIGLL